MSLHHRTPADRTSATDLPPSQPQGRHRPSARRHLRSAPAIVGGASALATIILASSSFGDIVVNDWLAPAALHHKRIGVPDLDQRRTGLLNNGNCYCVPTTLMNMMTYMANHGFPDVMPGPGNYAAQENWTTVRDMLQTLGTAVAICPGGPDTNDPDCIGGIPGMPAGCSPGGPNQAADGACSALRCSSTVQDNYNAMLNLGWMGDAEEDIVWTARFLDPNAPPATFDTVAQLGIEGNIVSVCYGFYQAVGQSAGQTIWQRNGGHCVTMNEAYASVTERWLGVRDPAQDNGNPNVQSPFVTRIHEATEDSFLLTTDPIGGQIQNWSQVTMTRLAGPWAVSARRMLDGYYAARPKTGSFIKIGGIGTIAFGPSLGGGGGGGSWPTGTLDIADFVQDEHLVGWYAVIAPPSTGGPGSLVHITPFAAPGTTGVTTLAETGASTLVLGRRSELFLLDASIGLLDRLGLDGTKRGVATIPGAAALCYEDATDEVLVLVPPSATAGGGSLHWFDSTLGSSASFGFCAAIDPSDDWQSPSLAVSPASGRAWIASRQAAYELDKFDMDGSTGATLCVVDSIDGFENLTSLEFDDAGRLFAVDGGEVKVFEHGAAGWTQQGAGAFEGVDVGQRLRVARSRSNWDPAIHDENAWGNISADEIEQGGTSVPDCLGDLSGDGLVDGADLGLLMAAWGGTGSADLNGDGVVNGSDLGALLGAWGPCGE